MEEHQKCEDCLRMKDKGFDLEICPKCNHYYVDGEICSCLSE